MFTCLPRTNVFWSKDLIGSLLKERDALAYSRTEKRTLKIRKRRNNPFIQIWEMGTFIYNNKREQNFVIVP